MCRACPPGQWGTNPGVFIQGPEQGQSTNGINLSPTHFGDRDARRQTSRLPIPCIQVIGHGTPPGIPYIWKDSNCSGIEQDTESVRLTLCSADILAAKTTGSMLLVNVRCYW